MKTVKKFKTQFIITFIFIPISFVNAFSQNEPPMWESVFSIRRTSVSLAEINQENKHLIYHVNYKDPSITSEATLDLITKAMLKEVFKDKWVIIYEYESMRYKTSQLPTRFTIYKYRADEKLGQVINVYNFKEAIGNGKLRYIDKNGSKRVIHCSYFDII